MVAEVPPVVFVPADFRALFPEFAPLTDPQLSLYFTLSGSFFVNSRANPAFRTGVPNMTNIAYLVTAHLAYLLAERDANGNPAASGATAAQTVGQITSASEGSVSVGLAAVATGQNALAAWYAQTKYGFMYWQATAQFRTALYSARPTVVLNPGLGPYPNGYY